jgi:hypothetical protein
MGGTVARGRGPRHRRRAGERPCVPLAGAFDLRAVGFGGPPGARWYEAYFRSPVFGHPHDLHFHVFTFSILYRAQQVNRATPGMSAGRTKRAARGPLIWGPLIAESEPAKLSRFRHIAYKP